MHFEEFLENFYKQRAMLELSGKRLQVQLIWKDVIEEEEIASLKPSELLLVIKVRRLDGGQSQP